MLKEFEEEKARGAVHPNIKMTEKGKLPPFSAFFFFSIV
jgi:hypothetical protein